MMMKATIMTTLALTTAAQALLLLFYRSSTEPASQQTTQDIVATMPPEDDAPPGSGGLLHLRSSPSSSNVGRNDHMQQGLDEERLGRYGLSPEELVQHEERDRLQRKRDRSYYPRPYVFGGGGRREQRPGNDAGGAADAKEGEANTTGTSRKIHTCTCLPKYSPPPNDPARFRWLHVPKTGTSFISTLWSYATSRQGLTIDMSIDSYLRPTCKSCYDFALMGRYPLEMYGRPHTFASITTQHNPLTPAELSSNLTNIVGFFRSPNARIVSAYDDSLHASGYSADDWMALARRCGTNNLSCYVTHPGIAGCTARMLAGGWCAFDSARHKTLPSNDTLISKSIKALRQMAFVGITEEWNESICQFHRKFGGKPRQNQFQNVHNGRHKHTIADLPQGYSDEMDEAVYNAALEEFNRRLDRGERCYKLLEEEEPECRPKTCAELDNKQCGEWSDGCGGTVACGVCDGRVQRDGLPDTWRYQCVEGKCARACPPWVEAGLWFRDDGDDNANRQSSDRDWIEFLRGRGAPVREEDAVAANYTSSTKPWPLELSGGSVSYLPPTDAVRLCVVACASHNASHQSFASQFCICGDYPTNFLHNPPTSAEYASSYNLKTPADVRVKRKPYNATLEAKDTQPKCCPTPGVDLPSRGTLPPYELWRKSFVSANFYETADLGCGSHRECELYGHGRNATVVVLDPEGHLCHLGRDDGDAIPNMIPHVLPRHYLRLTATTETSGRAAFTEGVPLRKTPPPKQQQQQEQPEK